MIAGLYVPGDSVVHRMPVGAKLVALAAVGALALFAPGPGVTVLAIGVVLALMRHAGVPLRWLRGTALTLFLFAGAIVGFHWLNGTPAMGVAAALGLVLAVLAASLVTATTRVSAMTDAMARAMAPLALAGIRPDRAAFAVALAIRLVPGLAAELGALQEARRARGARGVSAQVASPLIINSLRRADEMALAMQARGFDARPPAPSRGDDPA